MFGKLSSLVSYWKVLEVYLLKRFPSNKLPIFGMTFTYLTIYLAYKQSSLYAATNGLRSARQAEEKLLESHWRFNINRASSCQQCDWKMTKL